MRSRRRRSRAGLANQIDSYLRDKGSPLAGLGKTFVSAGRRYGVDPRLLVAISGSESSFGKHNYGSHNAWGWGPGIDFKSWGHAINSIAKGLRQNYLNEGRKTIPKIGAKWAPIGASNDPTNLNSEWVRNTRTFYRELGGHAPAKVPGRKGGRGARSAIPAVPGTPAVTIPGLPEISTNSASMLEYLYQSVGLDTDLGGLPIFKDISIPAEPPITIPGTPGKPGRPARPGMPNIKGGRGGFSGKKSLWVNPDESSTHETSGLAGFPAVDHMAPPGTIVRIKEPVRVYRHSGKSPKLGGPAGGAMGYSLYAIGLRTGYRYYITHLSKVAKKGKYKAGAGIGVVAYGPPSWSSPHAHVGINRSGGKRRRRKR